VSPSDTVRVAAVQACPVLLDRAAMLDLVDELTDPGGHAGRSWSLLEAFVPGPPVWIDAPPVAVDAEWHRLPMCGSVTVSTPGASGSRPPGGAALLLRVLGYSAPTDPRCVPQRAEGASSSQRPIPGFSR
jgi:hypothetical protein